MSRSTKRRHERNRALVKECRLKVGDPVTVERANGQKLCTRTESTAFLLGGAHAMIRVTGIPGNVRLSRVTPGWDEAVERVVSMLQSLQPPAADPMRRWLDKQGMTAKRFAKLIGVHPDTFSRWMGGVLAMPRPVRLVIQGLTELTGEKIPVSHWDRA